MKKWMFCMALFSAFLFAGCGGGNDHANDGHDDEHEDDGHGHGHGDEHGEAHEIGEQDYGSGYEAHVSQVMHESEKEGIFEVKVMKEGKAVEGARVTGWIGDDSGKEAAQVSEEGEWMGEEGAYDIHVPYPPEGIEGKKLWVRVRHGDLDVEKSFTPEHHHDE